MKTIQRNTEVVSISLSAQAAALLDALVKEKKQSKSAVIASLLNTYQEDKEWDKMMAYGRKIGKKLNITSEDDVDRILHEK